MTMDLTYEYSSTTGNLTVTGLREKPVRAPVPYAWVEGLDHDAMMERLDRIADSAVRALGVEPSPWE